MINELETTFETLIEKINELKTEHEKHQAGNKSAGARARKAIGEIKNLCTPYRKLSNDLDKHRKELKENEV